MLSYSMIKAFTVIILEEDSWMQDRFMRIFVIELLKQQKT